MPPIVIDALGAMNDADDGDAKKENRVQVLREERLLSKAELSELTERRNSPQGAR